MHADSFTADLDESSQLLTVSGEIDEDAAAAFRQALDTSSEAFTRPLVVDLTAVTLLPSAAVGVVATAMQRAEANGQSIDLVAEKGTIAQRVLQVCAIPHRTER